MKPRWRLVWPCMAAGSAMAAIAALALGEQPPLVLDYAWPAAVIVWSLLVLVNFRVHDIDQETISSQRELIERYREQSAHNIQGRWN